MSSSTTLSKIAKVFLNRYLFTPGIFRGTQLGFATFHLAVNGITLNIMSRPRFAIFDAKRAPLFEMLPVAIVLCGAVVLPNLSLAYVSIPFYQIVRELLAPLVTAMNLVLRVPQPNVSRMALISLVPLAIGVANVSLYQYHSNAGSEAEEKLGICAGFFGLLVSACYVSSTDLFQRRFEINNLQLAHNQAPLAALALLYIVPWTDRFPAWKKMPLTSWLALLMVSVPLSMSMQHIGKG